MAVIVAAAGILLFGYLGYKLFGLDRYLEMRRTESQDVSWVPQRTVSNKTAIVLGDGELARRTIVYLQNYGFETTQLTQPLPAVQEQQCQYLFALSNSDSDNLTICTLGRKAYHIEHVVSICNEECNRTLFGEVQVPVARAGESTPQGLMALVKEQRAVS